MPRRIRRRDSEALVNSSGTRSINEIHMTHWHCKSIDKRGVCFSCGVEMRVGGYEHQTNVGRHVFCNSCHNHLMNKFERSDALDRAIRVGRIQ